MKSATKGLLSFFGKKGPEIAAPGSRSEEGSKDRAETDRRDEAETVEKGSTFRVRAESSATVEELLSLAFHRSELMKFPEVASDPDAMAKLFANRYFNDHKNDPVLGSRDIRAREIGIDVSARGEIEVRLLEVNPSMIIRNLLRFVLGTDSGMTSLTDRRMGDLPFEAASRLRRLARDRGVGCDDGMFAGSVIASLIERYGGGKTS
jgi:hypothetical protein